MTVIVVGSPERVSRLGVKVGRIAGCVLDAAFAAVVTCCFGVLLVPLGATLWWLVTGGCVVFLARLLVTLRQVALAVEAVELRLDPAPGHIVLRGPWMVRRCGLDGVEAIQLWCDRGAARRAGGPHHDGMEVLLSEGADPPRRYRLGRSMPHDPETAEALREQLEPRGVKVVDWSTT
jgi:hypothetical protein